MKNYKDYEQLLKVSNEDLMEALEEYNDYYQPRIKVRKMKKEKKEDREDR